MEIEKQNYSQIIENIQNKLWSENKINPTTEFKSDGVGPKLSIVS